MAFEDFVNDLAEEHNANLKIETTPKEVKETMDLGMDLINKDYYNILALKNVTGIDNLFESKSCNLFKRGWKFQFGTSMQWAGLCDSSPNQFGGKSKDKNIYVSIDFVKHETNWSTKMKEVILHEIAHAIVVEMFKGNYDTLISIDYEHVTTNGHGKIWKEVCKVISGNDCPTFYQDAKFKKSALPYTYECTNCGYVGHGSFQSFTNICEKCLSPVFVIKRK